MPTEDDSDDEGQSDVNQLELIKSYAAFGIRAVRRRYRLAILTVVLILGSCLIGLAVWPRKYHSQSTIVFHKNAVLDVSESNPFQGGSEVVKQRENLRDIVRRTGVAHRFGVDRPPLLKLKDRIFSLFTGVTMSLEHAEEFMVASLEEALWVNSTETTFTIGVDWGSPEMAAKIVDTAQKKLLESRHVAEITTIQEKMAILEQHATEMRREIDAIAEQLRSVREAKLSELGRSGLNALALPSSLPSATAPKPKIALSKAESSAPSEAGLSQNQSQLMALQEELEAKKKELNELKGDRDRRLMVARAQLAELLDRYTRAHPEVQRLERTVESLNTGESPQLAALKNDVASLTERVKLAADAVKATGRASANRAVGGSAAASQPAAHEGPEILPAEILKLLESGTDVDPAVTVQLQGSVSKYAALRDSIRTARVDLDTAQAAFHHRYKVVAPAVVATRPSSPNSRKVQAIGFLVAVGVALLLTLLLELRAGMIVARWQVHQLELPILADLRLPPDSKT